MGMYDNFNYGMGGYNSIPFMPRNDFQMQPQNQFQQNNQYRQDNQNTSVMRIVENENTVNNTEVPMNGVYYFLKADGSEIYAKYWTKDMKTKVDKFILLKEESDNKPTIEDMLKGYFDNMENNICNRLDNLELKLDKPVANKTVNKSKEV